MPPSVAIMKLSCWLLCEDVCGTAATAAAGGKDQTKDHLGFLPASCANDTNTAGKRFGTNMSWNRN